MEEELIERISKLERRLDKLENSESPKDDPTRDMKVGTLAYCGKYESPNGEVKSTFNGKIGSISDMMKANSGDLAQVIDAFSSEDRLDIIKLLMKKPLTAKEIMEILNFPTTGKVYHHLSFLEKLGIIKKTGEQYVVVSDYVPCIVLFFAGVVKILGKRS